MFNFASFPVQSLGMTALTLFKKPLFLASNCSNSDTSFSSLVSSILTGESGSSIPYFRFKEALTENIQQQSFYFFSENIQKF